MSRRSERPADRKEQLCGYPRGRRRVEDGLRVAARGDRPGELRRNRRRDLLGQLVGEDGPEYRDAHGAPNVPPELDLARDDAEVSHIDGALGRVQIERHADADAEPHQNKIAYYFDLGRADVHLCEQPETNDQNDAPHRAEISVSLDPNHELPGDDARGDETDHKWRDEEARVRRGDPEDALVDEAHVQDCAEHREPQEESDDGGHGERGVLPEVEGHDRVRRAPLDDEEDHGHDRRDE